MAALFTVYIGIKQITSARFAVSIASQLDRGHGILEDYHRTLISANAQGHSANLNQAHEIGGTLLGHVPHVKEPQDGRAGLQAVSGQWQRPPGDLCPMA